MQKSSYHHSKLYWFKIQVYQLLPLISSVVDIMDIQVTGSGLHDYFIMEAMCGYKTPYMFIGVLEEEFTVQFIISVFEVVYLNSEH